MEGAGSEMRHSRGGRGLKFVASPPRAPAAASAFGVQGGAACRCAIRVEEDAGGETPGGQRSRIASLTSRA
jgi:hypothetical protein